MMAVILMLSRFFQPIPEVQPEGQFCYTRPLLTDEKQTVRTCEVCQKGDPLCPMSILQTSQTSGNTYYARTGKDGGK